MDNEKKDTLEQPIGENADFLTVNQYAEKYGYTVNQVKNFRTRGLFFEKKIPVEGKGRRAGQRNKDIVRVLLLDLPVDQQPTKRNIKLGNIREKDAAPFGYRKNSSADAERKKRLKEKYLPVFIEKAPPDKMVFGAEELLEMFGLQDNTFFRDWKGWGLEGREIPDSYRHLNTERPLTGKYMYLRRDVYRFLNGDWGHSKEGTADDILIGAVEDRTVLEGEYYKFNPNKVYPADGNGVLAWIDDTNIVREDKRQNKWTKFVPWEEQRIFIKNAFKLNAKGDYKHNLIVFSAPRGDGKSLAKGSKIIYLDGSVGRVEDARIGDLLMGPDSKPREVLALGRGTEEMFEVTPLRGEPFTCNKSHILALKYRKEVYLGRKGKRSVRRNEIVDITVSVGEFLEKGPDFRSRCMLYRVPVDWEEKPVKIDPYFLGIWAGDGDSDKLCISTPDTEVIDYLRVFSKEYGVEPRVVKDPRANCYRVFITNGNSKLLRRQMEEYGLFNNKHIPLAYKANSRKVRLRLLAGLVDSDGYRNRNSIEFTMKSRRLVDDIAFLARSLGFHAEIKETIKGIKSTGFKGIYYRLGISGDCSVIPNLLPRKKCSPRKQIKNILYTGIKSIRSLGEGEYYGIVLDGDHLYLLEDFTVTHNTYIIALLTLFRFFNRFGEIINLSGNSKEQATFAHYELCKKIIQNTPILKNTPGLVIKEKYISLMAGPKEAVCQIKAIPSSVGLLPGTTCAVFTELHNLEERQFFVDLWTSTRATPNAMVLVDTTVAAPGHIVYELWESQKRGDDPLLYFHHYADKHCNPETTPEQLNSFRRHMLEHEYNMYFRNRWEDATGGLFTADRIREMGYCGVNGVVGRTVDLEIAVQTLMDLDQKRSKYANARIQLATVNKEIRGIEETLITTDSIYHTPATSADLDRIQKVFGVNFIIGVGLDRAQMISKAPDRTVLTCVARGIVSPEVSYYFVLDMFIPKESTLTVLSEKILDWTTTYGWIDKVVIESYLGQDFYSWCLERGYDAECTPATFKNQKIVFTELYQLMEQGLLKAPKIPYYADDSGELFFGYSVKEDILREEMKAFSYSSTKKWFGAPEKRLKGGIKDDTIYSLAWAVYATQGEGIPFGMRGSMNTIGEAMVNKDVVGNYGN